jgi:hypothetical protein
MWRRESIAIPEIRFPLLYLLTHTSTFLMTHTSLKIYTCGRGPFVILFLFLSTLFNTGSSTASAPQDGKVSEDVGIEPRTGVLEQSMGAGTE